MSEAATRVSRGPVSGRVRDAILRGELVAGQRLVEADLCAQLGASRGSVRAALLELAAEGLVERVANRGARVRVVPLSEAIEIYEVRRVVEGLCAAKAAEHADEAEVDELHGIGEQMREAVDAGEVATYQELNQRLHRRIREISRQVTAADVLDRLRAQIVRQQFRLAATPGRPRTSLPEHLAVIEAVCSHDPGAAERAMHAHLSSVMDAMRASHAGEDSA